MSSLPDSYSLHSARGLEELTAHTFHGIARLRSEVFVVEQTCVYLDLDGRDAEPQTMQYWVESGNGEVVATLRVLDEHSNAPRRKAIGRVATSVAHRGRSLAAALLEAVIVDHGHGELVLEAQSYLTGWYERFGFVVVGTEYLEDGIPHTPMRREASTQQVDA